MRAPDLIKYIDHFKPVRDNGGYLINNPPAVERFTAFAKMVNYNPPIEGFYYNVSMNELNGSLMTIEAFINQSELDILTTDLKALELKEATFSNQYKVMYLAKPIIHLTGTFRGVAASVSFGPAYTHRISKMSLNDTIVTIRDKTGAKFSVAASIETAIIKGSELLAAITALVGPYDYIYRTEMRLFFDGVINDKILNK